MRREKRGGGGEIPVFPMPRLLDDLLNLEVLHGREGQGGGGGVAECTEIFGKFVALRSSLFVAMAGIRRRPVNRRVLLKILKYLRSSITVRGVQVAKRRPKCSIRGRRGNGLGRNVGIMV